MSDKTPRDIFPASPPKRRKDHRKPATVRAPMVRYSKKVFNELLAYIAEDGQSLWEACTHEGMPVVGTVIGWLNESDEAKEGDEKYGLSKAYDRAIEARTHYLEHMAMREARTPLLREERKVTYEWVPALLESGARDPAYPGGWKKIETGEEIKQVDAVDRSRLSVDTQKWFMSRMRPMRRGTRYGLGNDSAKVQVNENPGALDGNGKPTFVVNIFNSPDDD